jgi:hypothetical protein
MASTYTPIDFYEQGKHIRGPQSIFTFSLQLWDSHLAILKNILELDELMDYLNQEFSK